MVYVCCITGLIACSAPSEKGQVSQPRQRDDSASRAPAVSVPALVPDEIQRYRIDPAASTLHILVFRGGTLARLGHNHVISSHSLQGTIWRGAPIEQSGFEMLVALNELIVDDNAARAEEGEDFPLNLSDEAKSGTKANMLRSSLLDSDQYPNIAIRSVRVGGTSDASVILAALQIKDKSREVRVPVTLTQTGLGLQVQGAFDLRQSDFGMTPLSIAKGALQVMDMVKIKFRLVALPINPEN